MLLSPLLRHLMRRGTLASSMARNKLHVFADKSPGKP